MEHTFSNLINNVNLRELVMFTVPKTWNSKNLRPVMSQPIFTWDFLYFNTIDYTDEQLNEALEYRTKLADKGLYHSLPYDDFFLITTLTCSDIKTMVAILRIVRRGTSIDIYSTLLNLEENSYAVGAVHEIDQNNTIRFHPKWTESKEAAVLKTMSNKLIELGEMVSMAFQLFLYSLDTYEIETRTSNIKVKPSHKHRHNKWQGNVTETFISLNKKKVVYEGSDTSTSDKSARIEHDRRSHVRRYKSGKVIRVAASTINKGSPKGRKTTTYKVEV